TSASAFVFSYPSPTALSPLSLHDALPIWFIRGRAPLDRRLVPLDRGEEVEAVVRRLGRPGRRLEGPGVALGDRPGLGERQGGGRSEEHTSELQSRGHLVCRLLLEKKKNKK